MDSGALVEAAAQFHSQQQSGQQNFLLASFLHCFVVRFKVFTTTVLGYFCLVIYPVHSKLCKSAKDLVPKDLPQHRMARMGFKHFSFCILFGTMIPIFSNLFQGLQDLQTTKAVFWGLFQFEILETLPGYFKQHTVELTRNLAVPTV